MQLSPMELSRRRRALLADDMGLQLSPMEFLAAVDYWMVTDCEMKISSYWDNLADAKDAAQEFAREWKRVAFVCDRRGLVVCGFGHERE